MFCVSAALFPKATTAPVPSDRYSRGFLTGRSRAFSLFTAYILDHHVTHLTIVLRSAEIVNGTAPLTEELSGVAQDAGAPHSTRNWDTVMVMITFTLRRLLNLAGGIQNRLILKEMFPCCCHWTTVASVKPMTVQRISK